MKSVWLLRIVVALALGGIGAWLVSRTEWVEVPRPVPMSAALRADGSLVAQQYLQRLGLKTRRLDHLPELPPPQATLVLTTPFWRLALGDEARLRRWVEGGGHLVVDLNLLNAPPPGDWWPSKPEPRTSTTREPRSDWCRVLAHGVAQPPAFGELRGFVACVSPGMALQPDDRATWQLVSQEIGLEAQRVPVGLGRITAFGTRFDFDWQNGVLFDQDLGQAVPRQHNFSNRGLLEGQNAVLLAALVDARPGGEVWFVTRVLRPALPEWLWQQAAPALLLAAAALALLLWRHGTRFGPIEAAPATRRRSLTAQVEGLADFLFRHRPAALHGYALRALHEAAARRLPGWARLTPAARTLALARATGLPQAALERAQQAQVQRDRRAWSDTLALLETARRALLERRPGIQRAHNLPPDPTASDRSRR